ncbi:hypothetical protein E4T42_08541 [Aureobasidium subglaciale]|nr:hypothetical protein E4T42_08541 [Aureobasidium subglaciale]
MSQYSLAGFYGYQQPLTISENMSTLFDQDTKDYFFNQECPELTGSESSESPTASSFTSGGSCTAPSPSRDTKDLTLSESGVAIYSPVSYMSPLSSFGDNYLNTESSWSEQQIISTFDTSTQYNHGIWSCSQDFPTQLLAGVTERTPSMPIQSHSDGLFPHPTFQEMPPMSISQPSLEHNIATGFIDYGADGLVAPGHLFNTALDRYAFADPNPVLFSAQPMVGGALPLASSVNSCDAEMSSVSAGQGDRDTPDTVRNNRDDYLQEARRRGLSYKEIKRRGGFTEAESTLRGRVRILSKPKEMRVRKPQWNRSDVMLLVEAVEHFAETSQGPSSRKANMRQKANTSKLPWKKVAEWMLSHGASYPFAGATCAKKWEQIREMSF